MARSSRTSKAGGEPKAAKKRPRPGEGDQATVDEFDREDMGIAAKE
jgi:hypothetical protein